MSFLTNEFIGGEPVEPGTDSGIDNAVCSL
jgi:hypothetical protein